eukprot:1279825-Pyramimonas_sp.AAC.1
MAHMSTSGRGAGAIPSDGESPPSASVLLGNFLWELLVLDRGVLNCLGPGVACLRGRELGDGAP